MSNLSSAEIVDIARQIEACGEIWYDTAAKAVEDDTIRQRFLALRDDERRHGATFERLLTRFAEGAGAWRDSDEYTAWASSMADGRVFSTGREAREAAAALRDDGEAIRMALRFEHRTITFLESMRARMNADDALLLDALIDEEHGHVRALESLLDL